MFLVHYTKDYYKKFYDRYVELGLTPERAEQESVKDVLVDFEQGFQGWEYKFNLQTYHVYKYNHLCTPAILLLS